MSYKSPWSTDAQKLIDQEWGDLSFSDYLNSLFEEAGYVIKQDIDVPFMNPLSAKERDILLSKFK